MKWVIKFLLNKFSEGKKKILNIIKNFKRIFVYEKIKFFIHQRVHC